MNSKNVEFGLDIAKFKPFILGGILGLTSSVALNTVLEQKLVLNLIDSAALLTLVFLITKLVNQTSLLSSRDFSDLEMRNFIFLLALFNGFSIFGIFSFGFKLCNS